VACGAQVRLSTAAVKAQALLVRCLVPLEVSHTPAGHKHEEEVLVYQLCKSPFNLDVADPSSAPVADVFYVRRRILPSIDRLPFLPAFPAKSPLGQHGFC